MTNFISAFGVPTTVQLNAYFRSARTGLLNVQEHFVPGTINNIKISDIKPISHQTLLIAQLAFLALRALDHSPRTARVTAVVHLAAAAYAIANKNLLEGALLAARTAAALMGGYGHFIVFADLVATYVAQKDVTPTPNL